MVVVVVAVGARVGRRARGGASLFDGLRGDATELALKGLLLDLTKVGLLGGGLVDLVVGGSEHLIDDLVVVVVLFGGVVVVVVVVVRALLVGDGDGVVLRATVGVVVIVRAALLARGVDVAGRVVVVVVRLRHVVRDVLLVFDVGVVVRRGSSRGQQSGPGPGLGGRLGSLGLHGRVVGVDPGGVTREPVGVERPVGLGVVVSALALFEVRVESIEEVEVPCRFSF